MDATNIGWTSVRPESDEERFGMRSQERQAAFDKIEAERSSIEIDRMLWAFFQFARLDFVELLAASDVVWNAETDFLRTNAAIDAVRLWQQKPEVKNNVAFSNAVAPVSRPHTASGKASRTRSGRSEGGQEASLGRSAVVAARCKDRDGNLCAVSRPRTFCTKGIPPAASCSRAAIDISDDALNKPLPGPGKLYLHVNLGKTQTGLEPTSTLDHLLRRVLR